MNGVEGETAIVIVGVLALAPYALIGFMWATGRLRFNMPTRPATKTAASTADDTAAAAEAATSTLAGAG